MHQPSPHGPLPHARWRFPRRRVRRYLTQQHQARQAGGAVPSPQAAPGPVSPALLRRVLDGLAGLPDAHPVQAPPAPLAPPRDDRTPLVRFIDSELARTAPDRTPTEEIPIVGQGVSWR